MLVLPTADISSVPQLCVIPCFQVAEVRRGENKSSELAKAKLINGAVGAWTGASRAGALRAKDFADRFRDPDIRSDRAVSICARRVSVPDEAGITAGTEVRH